MTSPAAADDDDAAASLLLLLAAAAATAASFAALISRSWSRVTSKVTIFSSSRKRFDSASSSASASASSDLRFEPLAEGNSARRQCRDKAASRGV